MNITLIEYEDVPRDGEMSPGAAVKVNGMWIVSAPDVSDGIGIQLNDPEHFAICLFPRTDLGTVSGFAFEFASRQELVETLGDYALWTSAIVRQH
ncbi:hypothetical protein [Paraburkholderia sp. GAS42]|jgi:hypothetical protein|uniref:hypothetical protein n=1 Tax=Paraburkholderia sp. GAS42 TaxID=3035135 RepID=UPI003D1E01BD